MTEEEKIKRGIRERLARAPKFPTYCSICGRFAANFTRPVEVVHFDCWKSRQEPTMKPAGNPAK